MRRQTIARSSVAAVPPSKAPPLATAFILAAGIALAGSVISARAQTAPTDWPPLPETFESTGGGGWMITEYRPLVDGAICRTDFVTVSPDGKDKYPATVQWTAIARDGGVYCADGKWRTKDGSGSGATPLEVFIKDGVVRRAP